MLEVRDLEVAYGDLQVVWGVSFDVPERSIVAIIGPNGAGKTTTLRALMGLLPAEGGSVRSPAAGHHRHTDPRDRRAGLVMIPEERATFAGLSVDENLELGAYAWRARAYRDGDPGRGPRDLPAPRRAPEQMAGTLSGGERQMLAIGKALMAQPELLILDEPSLGLAPVIVEAIFEIITHIRRPRRLGAHRGAACRAHARGRRPRLHPGARADRRRWHRRRAHARQPHPRRLSEPVMPWT